MRVTKNRKQVYRYTGLSLLPKYWNKEKWEIRRSYPEPERENLINALEAWEKKYRTAAGTLADADEQHDAKAVFAKAIEGRKATHRVQLLAYIEELVQGMVKAGQLKNASVYRDLACQLHKFIQVECDGVTDVLLSA